MINVNEYFGGSVKSLGYELAGNKSTVGVIAPGEYEFGTSTHETMHIIEGSLSALLPEAINWQTYAAGQAFEVEKGTSFKVKTDAPVAYLCQYK
ncbi:pyrimidine/purine nucleoside phosphorylase [Pedobacter sp. BS3]|uniref:pyrimidine/purine nucleoside phosphorylase n=1 Tax=Pedobacter sp. BS3 TaxID=2567937 RepID=UPI0011EDDEE8|nr:pyrimidine/purine nucleoside phosphorylase [Pedobacter sp. BS3]TZF81046.1 pyrimidine/purine nucleoside phosphorylase [Pedobacter sp. BS3]